MAQENKASAPTAAPLVRAVGLPDHVRHVEIRGSRYDLDALTPEQEEKLLAGGYIKKKESEPAAS